MLCSQLQLVKDGDGYQDVKPLPCRAWTCDYCAPRRRAQLMAQVAAGEPNRCLTLTCSTAVGDSPADRYRRLHDAWRSLVKRIHRQFQLAPQKRWPLRKPDGTLWQDDANTLRTQGVLAKQYTKVQYFAFVEATENGEPHLHILLRSPFIPQNWLSQQMQDLLQSPVVWIDIIKSTKKAIGYVSKYVTKAPAQFGKTRRYWSTRAWQLNSAERDEYDRSQYQGARVVLRKWSELAEEIQMRGYIPVPQPAGWLRLHTLKSARRDYGEPDEAPNRSIMYKASVVLGHIKRGEPYDI